MCGVPGIGSSVKNIYKDPSDLWEVKQESLAEASIKTRLLNAFKSRKWKRKTKESDSKLKAPFTFPKLKVIKDDQRLQRESPIITNNYSLFLRNPSCSKNSVRRVKSLPAETPMKSWEILKVKSYICILLT